jgi:hypothetical protein
VEEERHTEVGERGNLVVGEVRRHLGNLHRSRRSNRCWTS